MTLDPRTPVLVGAAAISERFDDPGSAPEAAELMVDSAGRAAVDSGGRNLLGRVGLVAAMASTTSYRDPARLVADSLGLSDARTLLAEPGVLQQQVISRACTAVTAGEAEAVLLVGGEAKYRAQQASILDVEVADTVQDEEVEPDERLDAGGMVIHRCEIDARLVQAVHHYAMLENAIGAARGLSPVEQSAEVASLWERFNRVAVGNPDAWNREPVSAAQIATPSEANRMLATPYTKLHNSQWNVDQAAAFIITTAAVADETGVPRDRWVFALGAAESNHMVPVVERAEPGRCPGFGVVGEALTRSTGVSVGGVDHVELYSCFPAAVRLQVAELGVDPDRELTVTGGMTFAGGPFNHFVLQALPKLMSVLREDAGSTGLITSVSGMVTKQAAGMWSTAPPAALPEFSDVSTLASEATGVRPVEPGFVGEAEVVTSTVLWNREGPETAVAVVETPSGGRLIATSAAADVVDAFEASPEIGTSIHVTATDEKSAHGTISLAQR